ncbi:MAG TPA: SGNH/GDSL hydrolase family protein [Longimicrobiaceae bacterium]|nr:SGNH/GDSL hydrolase family protein [Longimicrobiaceae bacterium]
MSHIVLLGDSIFDNAAYVAGGPDVIAQLRERLPAGWSATLRAVDGAVIRNVQSQLRPPLEADAFLVVSVGGNDALGHVDILNRGARSFAEVLARLAEIGEHFERDYRAMLRTLLEQRRPTALCTIYYPRFPDPVVQRLAVTALTVFNDAIQRAAFEAGLPLLDLRLICDEDADYANPIEPSSHGGAKIADAIVRVVTEHDFSRGRTEVFTRG